MKNIKKYQVRQSFLFDYISKSIDANRLSHAYLLELRNINLEEGLSISTSLAKFIFCSEKKRNDQSCNGCNICNLIDLKNYPDFTVIEAENDLIKKEQIIFLKNYFSNKAICSSKQIYIIKGAEYLNVSASNTLLKFLEEPKGDVIAILLTTNKHALLKTIVSRCQTIVLDSLGDELNELSIFSMISDRQLETMEDLDKLKILDDTVDQIINIEFDYKKAVVNTLFYKNKELFKIELKIMQLFYFQLLKFNINGSLANFINFKEKILKISENNTKNDIITKLNVINKFIEEVDYNVNKELIIDNFLISMNKCKEKV